MWRVKARDSNRAYLAVLEPSNGSEVPLAGLLLPALVADVVEQLQHLVVQARAQTQLLCKHIAAPPQLSLPWRCMALGLEAA